MFQHSELTPRPGRIHWVSASSKKGPTTCLQACVVLHSKLLWKKKVQWSLGSVSPCMLQWVLHNKRTLLSELETVVSCSTSIPCFPGNHIPVFSGAAPSPQLSYSSCSFHGIDPTCVYTAQSRGVWVILAQRMSIFHFPGQGHQFREQHETQPSKRDSIQGSLLEPLERRSTLAKRML